MNWNNWPDTLHCLESVLRSDYPNFRVVVCDNCSTDDSVERIKNWARGKQRPPGELAPELIPLVKPGVRKPVHFVEFSQTAALKDRAAKKPPPPLVVIRNHSNGGYSAGNNVGIDYALKHGADYVWILNNDTLVRPDALAALVDEMDTHDGTGAAGALIYYASEPKKIQAYGGGRLTRFLGRDRFAFNRGETEYIAGTSLFVRRKVFEEVGHLDDGFFFYWEDVDYSRRVEKGGWDLTVVEGAVVYHKFSATVGSQSPRSDLFKVASLTRYFRKHRKLWWFFPVFMNIAGMLVNRVLRGQFGRLGPIVKETWRSVTRKL